MRSIITFLIAPLLFVLGVNSIDEKRDESFLRGEKIKYKVHYGFVNAGEAIMTIDDNYEKINGATCYQILVEGNSIGMFDFFLPIRDQWGTYIDTTNIIPHKFFMKIAEGKYRKHEIIEFDQNEHKADVKKYHTKDHYWRPIESHDIPEKVQDIVSGYYYLRTLNFKTMKEGEIISMNVFFEDEVFDFNIRYVGIDKVKTKLGTYEAIVLSPIMPENSLFDGENSIRVWLTNDSKKIPLKVKANMFVGAVEIDIQEYISGHR